MTYGDDWGLLGQGGDPWPTDPYEVDAAVQHYLDLAKAVREQADRLRQIGSENQLVGQYAPALQGSVGETADLLERAEGRFNTVATQLARWAPELSAAQRQSRALLSEAGEHHATAVANQPPTTPVDPTDAVAVADDALRDSRLQEANDNLSTLTHRMRNLREQVDQVGAGVARQIRAASDDSLKNHGLDRLREFVHDHKKILAQIADVLTWVATGIVIAVIVFGTGGLGLAAVLTVGALAVHTALAANGDSSWVDVGLDAFALATFGTGKLLTSGAKGLLAAREGVAAFENVSSGARTALADARGLNKIVVWAKQSNPVSRTIRSMASGRSRYTEVLNTEFKGSGGFRGFIERLHWGDKETAGLAKAVEAAAERLGPGKLLGAASRLLDASAVTWKTALVVDWVSKYLNDATLYEGKILSFYPHWGGNKAWLEWKESHTVQAISAP